MWWNNYNDISSPNQIKYNMLLIDGPFHHMEKNPTTSNWQFRTSWQTRQERCAIHHRCLLYYGQAANPTFLPGLTEITSAQSNPTQHTLKVCKMLMDCLWTYPNAKLHFTKSDMLLYIDSDVTYLVLPQAWSHIGEQFHLGNMSRPAPAKPAKSSTDAPLLTVCKRHQNVVPSTVETETRASFYNSEEDIPIICTLNILGHPNWMIFSLMLLWSWILQNSLTDNCVSSSTT